MRQVDRAGEMYFAITFRLTGPCPLPAGTKVRTMGWYRTITVDFRPKAFFYGKILNSHMTSIGLLVRGAVTVTSRPRFAYFTTAVAV